MAESSARPPVAIRIVRPYQSEDEFLENELETVGKTSVILIGAHPRPTGVILRFEMNLASGQTILRGEGRVLAHKERAFRGQAGLTLRFTRLDPKSKALVDRAAALREARTSGELPAPLRDSRPEPPREPAPSPPERRPSVPPAPPVSARPPPDPVLADILTSATPEPPPPAPRRAAAPPPSVEPPEPQPVPPAVEAAAEAPPPQTTTYTAPAPVPTNPPDTAPEDSEARALITNAVPGTVRTIERPADREALLERLRERARALPPERVQKILESNAR